jgi:hypothetical protein
MLFILLLFIPLNEFLQQFVGSNEIVDYFYVKDMSIIGDVFPNLPTSIFGIRISVLPSIIFSLIHTTVAFGFFGGYYYLLREKKEER